MNNIDLFAAKLRRLGGLVRSHESVDNYIDLELFIVDATNYMNKEERLTTCMEHWLRKFGCLLYPSKIRRILRSDIKYCPYVLGIFVSIISEHSDKNFGILKDFIKRRNKKTTMFGLSVKVVNPDFKWRKGGFLKPTFYPDFDKYIRSGPFFKNCHEIINRVRGMNQVDADIQAYKAYNKEVSLYRIAKSIFSDYSLIHKAFSRYSLIK